jgi:hypothetical protein
MHRRTSGWTSSGSNCSRNRSGGGVAASGMANESRWSESARRRSTRSRGGVIFWSECNTPGCNTPAAARKGT